MAAQENFTKHQGRMNALLSKLGLASGQFGLDQPPGGRGRPRDVEARDILSIAARSGLGVLEVSGHSVSAETLLAPAIPRPMPFRLTITTVRPDRGPQLRSTPSSSRRAA